MDIRKSFPNVCFCVSHDADALNLSSSCEVSPETFLLCLKVEIPDEDAALGIVWGWVRDGVDADVAVKDDGTVEFEGVASGGGGPEDDVGV